MTKSKAKTNKQSIKQEAIALTRNDMMTSAIVLSASLNIVAIGAYISQAI